MLTRRHLISLSAAQAFAPTLFVRAARAQAPKADFPSRPVRLIVPVAAGGPTDLVARMLAERLSKLWGQQLFIENKGDAGTNIGNEYAARADPDGYTVLFATASLAVNASLYRSLSYDPIADFAPVSLATRFAYYDVTAWQALFVPARTPPDVVRKLSADTNAALADPAIKEKLAQTGYVAEGSSPEELDKLLRAEIAKWSAVIKSVGIKID